jgi:glycerate dehydrogenase
MKNSRIVFLDAGTVNYGDISLAALEKLGSLKVFHNSTAQQIPARIQNAEIAVTNKCFLRGDILRAAKKLRCIAVTATGYNNIDLAAAKDLGIAVYNVPGYSTDTVAQNTIALLLALAGNIFKYNEAAHSGLWSRSPFFVYGAHPIIELKGKKLGIIGYGSIGKRVGQMARALGMELLISAIPGRKYSAKETKRRTPFDKVLRTADFITIHTPLTDLTRDLIDSRAIRKMKTSVFLLNCARGGIINERALFVALKSKRIAGAALDVLTEEPPPRDHILLGAPNLLLMPHVTWASREVRSRLIGLVAANIRAFLSGKKRNRII